LFSPLGRLKLMAWIEGISFLVLLFVTMPLKYFAHMPAPNRIVGMAHGVLFILYVLLLLLATEEYNWKRAVFWKGMAASVIPFATFWAERKLFVSNPLHY
jgi:integral membrane protein